VSILHFVRLPAAAGPWRVKAPGVTVTDARRAPARQAAPPGRVPVLHLACTRSDNEVSGLAAAVLARLAGRRHEVGTVVLELNGAAVLEGRGREELCTLQALLRQRGTVLRLVIGSREARDALTAAAEHRFGPEAVHACARAAMLAVYAQESGPGLVDAAMRAALAAPPDTL
jgi:hypothetical protein